MNEATELRFYPVGGFPKSGTVDCPSSGNDADCSGDKYEACLLHVACGGLVCDAAKQLKLAQFLACFEGDYDSAPAQAATCATKVGFDAAAIKSCAADPLASAAAFDAVQAAGHAGMQAAKCFPWIVIDGVVMSKDPEQGCFGVDAGTAPLLAMVCDAVKAAGVEVPPGCP